MSIDVALGAQLSGGCIKIAPQKIVPVVGSGQWVRPRSSAMSIDVALSTRRGVGRDTYSLPQENAAAPRVARRWVRHHYIKAALPVPCQWT